MAACLEVHSVYASDAEGSVVGSHAPYVGDQCQASECVTKPRVATQGRAHLAAFSRPATWAARDMQQEWWGACGGVDAHGSSGDSSVDQEMRCLGVAVALYDYAAQADDELTLTEGDTLYVDELADEAWYKARLRDGSHADQSRQ